MHTGEKCNGWSWGWIWTNSDCPGAALAQAKDPNSSVFLPPPPIIKIQWNPLDPFSRFLSRFFPAFSYVDIHTVQQLSGPGIKSTKLTVADNVLFVTGNKFWGNTWQGRHTEWLTMEDGLLSGPEYTYSPVFCRNPQAPPQHPFPGDGQAEAISKGQCWRSCPSSSCLPSGLLRNSVLQSQGSWLPRMGQAGEYGGEWKGRRGRERERWVKRLPRDVPFPAVLLEQLSCSMGFELESLLRGGECNSLSLLKST